MRLGWIHFSVKFIYMNFLGVVVTKQVIKLMAAVAGLIGLGSGFSYAADSPQLIGAWEASSGYWAYAGTAANPAPVEFSQTPLHIKLNVTEQKGNAFSGYMTRYDGDKRNLVGVIAPDGKSIYLSLDSAIENASLSKNNSELTACGITVQTVHNRAHCTVFKRAN